MSMRTTWGAKLIDRVVDAPGTIKIEANEMELHGFVDDTFSEYRRRSVVRREPGGSLTCTAPRCGRRYLGFVIFDSLSPETVEFRIDGVTRGVALVDGNNQRERLCTLAQPYDFQGGETVCLQTVEHEEDESPADACPLREMTPYFSHWEGGGESHRIESIAFFAEPPPQSDLPCEFAHVHAEPLCDAEESDGAAPAASPSVRLTWITTWDARCRIEYWHEGSTPKEIVEERRAANHRVLLSDLRPGARYRYRLTAPNRDGDVVESGPHRFETSPGRPAAGSADRERVTLTVAGSAAASSCAVPVRSGVPFPRGVLGSSANLRLVGSDGEEIPTQARTLGRWPDGTVKWALLDFQTTGREGPERTCTLEYGSQVTRADCATSLQVHEHPDRVIVDTGRVGITFDRTRFGPFAAITRGGRPYLTGARLVVTGTDGTEYVSTRSEAASVRVEEAGPLCCIVVSAGTHRSSDGDRLFRSIFRVHAFAGLPYVRVEHTFVNDNPDSMFTSIASMVLQIDVASGGIRQIDLRQTHDERAVVGGTARRGRLDGSVTAGDAGVSVVDFWQQYPKSLTTHDGGIDVGICPDLAGGGYDVGGYDVGGEEERKLYYYLTNGAYRFREGAAKTHTCYVGRDLPPHPAPVAHAPPRWMSESGAFGEVTPAGDGSYPEYERILAEAFDGYLAERERQRDYGMMNFGDCFVGNDTWKNTEYDMGYSFFLQWARTGERRHFESACRAAVHHRDVDTCHASGDPTRVGGVYRHSVGHVGEYYDYDDRSAAAVNIDDQEFKKRSSTGGVPWGRFAVSHTWVDGFLLHHYLTGDRRSAQTARIVADRYAGDHTRNYEFTNCRNNGWHLILVMQMYEATGDRFYLNAAHIIIERTLERQTSDGGWRRMLVYGHCLCDIPRHLGNAGFMVGILLVGMKMYHQATDDRRVAESLIRGAEFLVDALWKGEAFQYTPCPRSPMKPADMGHIIAAICYACRIGGDGRLAAVLAPATRRMFEELTGAARILSAQARVAPNILYELQRLTNGDGR